ncbi:hypothetical protein [Pseudomonas citronellolis]|uniref:hypothetical protein n=1 Tax=Pseudomonas citronellolis TaxID=53408 RepID=UPI0023E3D05D|nr:hypothetical protein [Pseudomonas citronellolis]MDF3933733.1 hypothetical protein [Pseudomonas citronellolis]
MKKKRDIFAELLKGFEELADMRDSRASAANQKPPSPEVVPPAKDQPAPKR